MTQDLTAAFADPVGDAQSCFRAVLDAMARPGSIHRVGGVAAPPPLCDAAAAVLLTLVDQETVVWLDPAAAEAQPWITFHTGAALAGSVTQVSFAMALTLPDITTLPAGTDDAPEASATVILQVASLASGAQFELTGPGLKTPSTLWVDGIPAGFAAMWAANHASFPRGIDLILCAGSQLAALPRSVSIREV